MGSADNCTRTLADTAGEGREGASPPVDMATLSLSLDA